MTDIQTNGVHPKLKDHYDGMNKALYERDEALIKVTDLTNQLAIANGTINRYREDLDRITKERDYYFRKSFAFTNTLSSCRNQIENMMTMVEHETNNPGPDKLPVDTLQQLEDKVADNKLDGAWTKND